MFGDALASLLALAGYKVTREYYINDAGAQVDVLARSAYLRYREALGEDIGAIPKVSIPANISSRSARASRSDGASLQGQAGGGMAADRAQARHRHDDGDDPRRSRGARHAFRTNFPPNGR